MARLIAMKGPAVGTQYPLPEVCVLGRSRACHIYVDDPTVSRQHARISREGGRYWIEDLGSGNGTQVNGTRAVRGLLQTGDVISISGVGFRFVDDEGPTKGPPTGVTVVETAPAGAEPFLNTIDATSHHVLPDTVVGLPPKLDSAFRRLQTIYAVAAAISTTVDLDTLLGKILGELFRVFPQAAVGAIMFLDEETRRLVPRIVRSRQDRQANEILISRAVVNEVLQHRRSVLSADGALEGHRPPAGANVGSESTVAAPLLCRDELLGILYLTTAGFQPSFGYGDLDLITGIASQAAIAIGNARMHQVILGQQRLAQDLRLAEQVQRGFLPVKLPTIAGCTFASHYDSAFEVGGDFYDFIDLGDGSLGLVIGDVSGKGVSAALLMARMSSELRFCAMAAREPREVLARANRALLETAQDDVFVTAVYGRFDPRTGRLSLANAGHVPPIVRRLAEGSVTRLERATGLALGMFPGTVFEQEDFSFLPGDTLLLYTDGVTEAESPQREAYGFARLQRILASGPTTPDLLLRRVLTDVRTHVGDAPQYDDLTVVAMGIDAVGSRFRGASPLAAAAR